MSSDEMDTGVECDQLGGQPCDGSCSTLVHKSQLLQHSTCQQILQRFRDVLKGIFDVSNTHSPAAPTPSLESALQQLRHATASRSISPATVSKCHDIIRQINLVSNHLASLEEEAEIIDASATKSAITLLQSLDYVENNGNPSSTEFTSDDTALTERYRQYFLEHLSWPYPSARERDELLSSVPGHGRAQLSNWFVNSRRRSGWAELSKKYGRGTKEGMEALLTRVENGRGNREEIELLRKVHKHFEDDGSNLIRPDVRELVEELEEEFRTLGSNTKKRKYKTYDEDESDRSEDSSNSSKRHLSESWSFSSSDSGAGGNLSRLPSDSSISSVGSTSSMSFSDPVDIPVYSTPSIIDSDPLFSYNIEFEEAKTATSPSSSWPPTRRAFSDSHDSTPRKNLAPLYRSVSSSFALGMEATLSGSLTLPLDPDFIDNHHLEPAWINVATSEPSGTSPPSIAAPFSDGISSSDETVILGSDTTSNQWFETLQDDRWTNLYPWLSDSTASSQSGNFELGGDFNWLSGIELG